MTFVDDNGNELNIAGSFAMTKQAVSFFSGTIRGDVSITFSVDNNSVNRETLGYQGPQMTSQVAWTKQAFNRVRNGNILDRGYIVIQSEDEDNLSCFYVSGNSNWVQLVKGLITDLDFSGKTNGKDYCQLWTSANIQTITSATEGVIFPLVDWIGDTKWGGAQYALFAPQNFTTDQPTCLPSLYPCFYLQSLVKEIASQNDIKIAGNLLDDPLFKTMIIGPYNALIKRNITLAGVTIGTGTAQTYTAGVVAKYLNFGTVTSDMDMLWSTADDSFTVNKTTGLIFNMTHSGPVLDATNYVAIYRNGVSAYKWDSASKKSYSSVVVPVRYGDKIEVFCERSAGGAFTINSFSIEEAPFVWPRDYANPSDFLPKLQCIDVIKFVFNYFGCSVYYNEFSRTLTATIIDNISQTSALDWSEYYLSHRSEYTVNQAKNNYIKWAADGRTVYAIEKYNRYRKTDFGEGNIETGNTLKEDNELYQFPFAPSNTALNKNGFYLTNVPLVNLTDNEGMSYSSTAAGTANRTNYTLSATPQVTGNLFPEIFRIKGAVETSRYYYTQSQSSTTQVVFQDWVATDAGLIYRQSIEFIECIRILTVKPSTNVSDFASVASFRLWDESIDTRYANVGNSGSTVITSWPYAIFTKPVTNLPIDGWKNNLSIDNPQITGYTDPTIKELYYNSIQGFLNNPNIKVRMIIPEAIFQSFVFDQFIYLKTERLTGYFFVDSIQNYVDGTTPVDVNLYML